MTKLAIVGATGLVGRKFLEWGMRMFPDATWVAVASSRSKGMKITVNQVTFTVESIDEVRWNEVDTAFFSAGSEVSRQWVPVVRSSGCRVIDNTSAFRLNDEVPLIVPEINSKVLKAHDDLIANPNCSTIQMVIALDPIKKLFGINKINVSTYQSLSGAGQKAVDQFCSKVEDYQKDVDHQDPFKCTPFIGQLDEQGYCEEERKMMNEPLKIWEDLSLEIEATTVRVPSLYCHGEAVYVETIQDIDIDVLYDKYNQLDYIKTVSYQGGIENTVNTHLTSIGRMRVNAGKRGLHLWVEADNLIRGAVFNALKIYEKCIIMKEEVVV